MGAKNRSPLRARLKQREAADCQETIVREQVETARIMSELEGSTFEEAYTDIIDRCSAFLPSHSPGIERLQAWRTFRDDLLSGREP